MAETVVEDMRKRYAVKEAVLSSTLGIVVRGCKISGIMPGGPADAWDEGNAMEGDQNKYVEAQDEILAVDGVQATPANIVQLLRGKDEVGSEARLTVKKGRGGQVFEVFLTRQARAWVDGMKEVAMLVERLKQELRWATLGTEEKGAGTARPLSEEPSDALKTVEEILKQLRVLSKASARSSSRLIAYTSALEVELRRGAKQAKEDELREAEELKGGGGDSILAKYREMVSQLQRDVSDSRAARAQMEREHAGAMERVRRELQEEKLKVMHLKSGFFQSSLREQWEEIHAEDGAMRQRLADACKGMEALEGQLRAMRSERDDAEALAKNAMKEREQWKTNEQRAREREETLVREQVELRKRLRELSEELHLATTATNHSRHKTNELEANAEEAWTLLRKEQKDARLSLNLQRQAEAEKEQAQQRAKRAEEDNAALRRQRDRERREWEQQLRRSGESSQAPQINALVKELEGVRGELVEAKRREGEAMEEASRALRLQHRAEAALAATEEAVAEREGPGAMSQRASKGGMLTTLFAWGGGGSQRNSASVHVVSNGDRAKRAFTGSDEPNSSWAGEEAMPGGRLSRRGASHPLSSLVEELANGARPPLKENGDKDMLLYQVVEELRTAREDERRSESENRELRRQLSENNRTLSASLDARDSVLQQTKADAHRVRSEAAGKDAAIASLEAELAAARDQIQAHAWSHEEEARRSQRMQVAHASSLGLHRERSVDLVKAIASLSSHYQERKAEMAWEQKERESLRRSRVSTPVPV